MSAFIISEKCMRNIIYNLFWNHEFKNLTSIFRYNDYRPIDEHDHNDFHELANEFYLMNREAVKQRYNEPEDSDYIKIPDYKKIDWTSNGTTLNKYQALMSMRCLRYQCTEGNVPESKLYNFLEQLIHNWMLYIMEEIPEYKQAEWD